MDAPAAAPAAAAAAPVAAPPPPPPPALVDREADIQGVFVELLEQLPAAFKHVLLIRALEFGPGVLEGLEPARDAIL